MSHANLFRSVLLAIVTTGLLAGPGCRGQQDASTSLRWGADEEGGMPYIAKDPKTGKYDGFEVDLAAALARELKRPIEFKQYDFKSLTKGLKRGDLDLAMNGLEITEDRKQEVRFSRPYYIYRLQLVTRSDDPRFKGWDDLQGKKDVKVGTLSNTAAWRLLEKHGVPNKTYDSQVDPYRDLAQQQVDAVLLDLPIALYVVKKNDELNSKLQFVGEPFEPGQYAIAFRKDNEALATQFDEAILQLVRNGELKRIYDKWGLWNDDQQQLGPQTPAPSLKLDPKLPK